MRGKQNQLFLPLPCQPSQYHRFPCIVEYLRLGKRQLGKDPVCQALKAHNVKVHRTLARVQAHDLLLRLHGGLLRYDQEKMSVRLCHRLLNQLSVYVFRFPAA